MLTFDDVYAVAVEVAANDRCYRDAALAAGVLPDEDGDLECWYFGPTGQPACLVGQVLDRLDLRHLATERTTVPLPQTASAAPWLEHMDQRSVEFLSSAQHHQDVLMDRLWSDCIEAALEELEDLED